MLPLPCGDNCGNNLPSSNPLTHAAADAPPLKTVEAIATLSEAGTVIPGLNVPSGIISVIVRSGQGRFGDAGDNLLNVVPGVSWLRRGKQAASSGRNFAERLFLSKRFGITSDRFANSATFVTGVWNKPKSLLKIGWSSTGKKGGGMQLRIGIGKGDGNKAWKHVYIPKTFVPNSFANPSIGVKRSLFRLGQGL